MIVATGANAQSPRHQTGERRDAPTSVRTITLHWDQVPLSEAVERLARALQHPIFVDRRVDPTRRVSFSARDQSPDVVLENLAAELSLGVSQLDSVGYLGPAETASQLRTLAALRREEIKRLPPSERKVLLARQGRSWPRLAEPREMIVEWLQSDGWSVRHAERIPYDLWPAGQLPPLSLADQLTLVLAGFDRSFAPVAGQQAIEIRPIVAPVTLTKSYRVRAGRMPELDWLKKELPDADLQIHGSQLHVAGRAEDHERLMELLGRQPSHSKRTGPSRNASGQSTEQRYTLRVDQQPVGAVLKQLGKQLSLNVQIDQASIAAAGLSLDKRVSFAVQDVSLDGLLDALLKPAGLAYELDGQEVTITPRSGK